MHKGLKIAVLAVLLLALALLAPSPALMEGRIPLDAPAGPAPLAQGYKDGMLYEDGTIRAEIVQDRYLDTPMFVARVRIADASQLRTMLAGRYGTQKTALATTLAERGNAVLAVNGDYYSYVNTGLVVRQGHTYRYREDAALDVLMIDDSGDLHTVIGAGKEALDAAYQALGGAADEGGRIVQAFTFGPALVVDGARAHDAFTRPDGSENKRTQRMVIAQDGPLSYVLVCCEGPDNENSKGLTLDEMADYMLALGVRTAYNLDGGGSTTMVYKGAKVNALSTSKNRSVSDILYFCTAQEQ